MKLDQEPEAPTKPDAAVIRVQRSAFLSSFSRSVSPPARSSPVTTPPVITKIPIGSYLKDTSNPKSGPEIRHYAATAVNLDSGPSPKKLTPDLTKDDYGAHHYAEAPVSFVQPSASKVNTKRLPSPFQFIRMQGLPDSKNVDTITLKDILGDVMIKEAWLFNFLFDVDWVMEQFDSDVRRLVKVKLIHGFWKRDDHNKAIIDEACSRYTNVEARAAYLKDSFGTHHTKMMILIRHDDASQVIISTANMISKDWTIMTNAVWRSPLLPVLPEGHPRRFYTNEPLGSGQRFKHDLLQYLGVYGKQRTDALIDHLTQYDFHAVRGALIGHVPSETKVSDSGRTTCWGWPALRDALQMLGKAAHDQNGSKSSVNSRKRPMSSQSTLDSARDHSIFQSPTKPKAPHIVCQVSSIATLPKAFLPNFFTTLRGPEKKVTFSIVFPTKPEVRQSLGGYTSGGSIFMKVESAQAKTQLETLRPHLCHWTAPGDLSGRTMAAPHIKTYIRFSSTPSAENLRPDIDWALLTSANLSTQAWGTAPPAASGKGKDKDKEPEVRVSSYELGVLVWPALYDAEDDSGTRARIVPVFGKDTPEAGLTDGESTVVGLRMPYDLPLTPYTRAEMPWAAALTHTEPDRHGKTWPPKMG